jgi:hypothetical protein
MVGVGLLSLMFAGSALCTACTFTSLQVNLRLVSSALL